MPAKPKVGILTSAPTPYRNPFFKRLAQRDDVEIKVVFMTKVCGSFNWHSEMVCDFPHEFLEPSRFLDLGNYPLWPHPGLIDLLKREQFDAVVLGGYFLTSFLYAALWCVRKRVPYIFWIESHGAARRSMLRKLFHRSVIMPFIKRAAAFITVSGYAKNRVVEWGIPPEKIRIILNAPDVDRWIAETRENCRDRDGIRMELGVGEAPLALFVGRMVPEKGVEELIESVAMVRERAPGGEPFLLMIGEGPLLESVRRKAAERGLERIRFEGFIDPDKLYPYYAAADFFILSSRYEPFGVVAQEAAAAALPLILSDCCGAMSELLKDGVNGFVFRAGDPDDLAEAIQKMLSRREDWRGMGAASRALSKKYDYTHGEKNFIKTVEIATGAKG